MDQHLSSPATEDKLADALDMLAAGFSLDAILADAGDDAIWLRPLLETASDVNQLRDSIPIPPPTASLRRMLAHARKTAPAAAPPAKTGWWASLVAMFAGSANGPAFRMANLAASVAVAFLAVLLLGGGLAAASQSSLPGDTTYGIKRTTEAIRLILTLNDAQQARLADMFNQRRQEEAQALLDEGREASLGFDQWIDDIDGRIIRVDNLVVELEDYTVINGELAPGALVHFEVVTHPPDGLHALGITVIEPAPTSEPTPEPTDTPEPDPTAEPTEEATFTPEPDPTVEPEPEDTPAPPKEVTNTNDPAAGDNPNSGDSAGNENATVGNNTNDNSATQPAINDPAAGDDNINHNDGDLTDDHSTDDHEFDDPADDNFDDNSDGGDDGFDDGSDNSNDDGFDDGSDNSNDGGFDDGSGDDGFDDGSDNSNDDGFDDGSGDDGFDDGSEDDFNDNEDDFNDNEDDFNDNEDDFNDNTDDNSNDNSDDNSNDNSDDNSNDNSDDNSGSGGGNSGKGGGSGN